MTPPPPRTLLDPFDLLGVTIDSTPEEARAGFRTLALLAHPDKGGRVEDMKALLVAFRFVAEQLGAVNRSMTVEDREAEFAAFCKAQVEAEDVDGRVASLRDLLSSVGVEEDGEELFRREFNSRFDVLLHRHQEPSSSSIQELIEQFTPMSSGITTARAGYGSFMAPSEYASASYSSPPIPTYSATVSTSKPSGFQPFAAPPFPSEINTSAAVHSTALTIAPPMGGGRGRAFSALACCVADYAEAHGGGPGNDLAPPPTEAELAVPLEARYATLLKARERRPSLT